MSSNFLVLIACVKISFCDISVWDHRHPLIKVLGPSIVLDFYESSGNTFYLVVNVHWIRVGGHVKFSKYLMNITGYVMDV